MPNSSLKWTLAVGIAGFFLVAKIRKHVTDPVLDTGISLVVPFATYIAAERIHASGVVAVVVARAGGLFPALADRTALGGSIRRHRRGQCRSGCESQHPRPFHD